MQTTRLRAMNHGPINGCHTNGLETSAMRITSDLMPLNVNILSQIKWVPTMDAGFGQ